MSKAAFTRTIDFELTQRSIDKAIREINTFKKELSDAMQGLIEELADSGVAMTKVQISILRAVDTGALMASVGRGAFDPETRTGIVYAGSYYAMFVEFGTGIVGKDEPHPGLKNGEIGAFSILDPSGMGTYTEYDTNHHGEKGWWYRKVGDKKYSWTKGREARPFMYRAYLLLKEEAEKHGAEILSAYIV